MAAYVVNEDVAQIELDRLQAMSPIKIQIWRVGDATLPKDTEAIILLIREDNSALEEKRVLTALNAGVRMICVYVTVVPNVSELVSKYCSAKVALESGGLGEALAGNDQVQEKHDGTPAPRNPQKPHNC